MKDYKTILSLVRTKEVTTVLIENHYRCYMLETLKRVTDNCSKNAYLYLK